MNITSPRQASAEDAARLAAAAADEDGALNDVIRADLPAPAPDSGTWLVPSGLVHVQRDTRGDERAGERGDARGERTWLLGMTAEPAAWSALLALAADHVARQGGGEITWWLRAATDDDIATATAQGYAVARRQHELRVRLPIASPPKPTDDLGGVQLRTFRPSDIDDVLKVNNAAFAGHHEQSGWTRSILEARMVQPWFDATLFVVADGALEPAGAARHVVGFNWLKPHPASERDVERGEIYVIAVDPAEHGHGLGRRLARHGLELLYARGFPWASLFVAADNPAALGLYESLGFTTHRTDVALVINVMNTMNAINVTDGLSR